MAGHHELTGPDPALSSDSLRRVTQYQTAPVNVWLRCSRSWRGVPASEADDLVAGAQCQVVELDGMAPASWGSLFADGWDDGVRAVGEALVGIADREWSRRGGRLAGAAELAVHIADVRQRERADLVRLERFVRESVLPGIHPHATARRRVLGERPAVCAPRARGTATGTASIVCTLDAGYCDPDDKPPFKDAKPGGQHNVDGVDLGAACIPHAAV